MHSIMASIIQMGLESYEHKSGFRQVETQAEGLDFLR
jgi:hypothetical protein